MSRIWIALPLPIAIGLSLILGAAPLAWGQGEPQSEPETRAPFTLIIVGPDGNPVPNVKVEIRVHPAITAEETHVGTWLRKSSYGTFIKTDENGQLALTLPNELKSIAFNIQHPGYGPYWAGWNGYNHPIDLPGKHTAELGAGWSIGGIVVNEEGKPVEAVEISPSVRFKKRPGDNEELYVGTNLKTDAEGKWRFDSVPASMSDVHLSFSHSSYQPLRESFPRSGHEIALGATPAHRFVMTRGLTISGCVTDEEERPIADALVRTKFLNDVREARTDKEGVYRIEGCEPRMTRVVASAAGRAMELQTVRVEPGMEPVDFVLRPGGSVRVRVVDEEGKGIPKARIFFQTWRGRIDYFEFDHVPDRTDENGVWEWHEAPLDVFEADITRPGGMYLSHQPIKAREEEYVFQPPRALVISGRILDALTGKPIGEVRIIPGSNFGEGNIHWHDRGQYQAKGGTYRIQMDGGNPQYAVKVEAKGYRSKTSRNFGLHEGHVEYDFQLTPAQDVSVVVVDAAGNPAPHARVAIGTAGSQISIENGEIDFGSTYATEITGEADGSFTIPSQEADYLMVITHPAGFAYINTARSDISPHIKLTPWARIEGTFHIAGQVAPNIRLEQDTWYHLPWGGDQTRIFTSNYTTSGEHGEFTFERVFPGSGAIGRQITLMVDDGATEVTSAVRMPVTTASGETLTIELGKTGRRIIGQLLPPEGHRGKVDWNFIVLHGNFQVVYPPRDDPPAELQNDEAKVKAWREEWAKSPRGVAWRLAYEATRRRDESSPHLRATVDQEGRFTIDDVPPGNYILSSRFSLNQAPGELKKLVVVVPDDDSTEPIDLGQIRLTR